MTLAAGAAHSRRSVGALRFDVPRGARPTSSEPREELITFHEVLCFTSSVLVSASLLRPLAVEGKRERILVERNADVSEFKSDRRPLLDGGQRSATDVAGCMGHLLWGFCGRSTMGSRVAGRSPERGSLVSLPEIGSQHPVFDDIEIWRGSRLECRRSGRARRLGTPGKRRFLSNSEPWAPISGLNSERPPLWISGRWSRADPPNTPSERCASAGAISSGVAGRPQLARSWHQARLAFPSHREGAPVPLTARPCGRFPMILGASSRQI